MAKDIGEEIVGAWLRHVEECDFVQYNVPTRKKQGEVDVLGLNLKTQTVYICEVATHLHGLDKNYIDKLSQKFQNGYDYIKEYNFKKRFLFWSPIVQDSKIEKLEEVCKQLSDKHNIIIELVINEVYSEKIKQLQKLAQNDKTSNESSVFRLLQILEHLHY